MPKLAAQAGEGPLGSGNAWIRVIPTLSGSSCKNGEKLTVGALIKAQAGVRGVEAEIVRTPGQAIEAGPQAVARLTLRPSAARMAGMLAYGTVGLWEAEWTASGLIEGEYTVRLRIEDRAGRVFTDSSLTFTDPTAGFTIMGSTNYPNNGMTRDRAVKLDAVENSVRCAVVDAAAGFAYLGTETSPGIVVKINLATFARVGQVQLDSGENQLTCAVIDTTNGAAYFGTYTSPGIVVKIDLATFTRAGAITLNAGENELSSAVIDPAAGFAYFGTDTAAGRVVKINLATFARVGAITLNAGENYLMSAVIDPAAGFAYFGTGTAAGRVVKINLATFTRTGAITLNAGEDNLYCAVIDTAAGFAYFGTNTSAGRVVKVNLTTFARTGAVTLNAGEDYLWSAAIDTAAGFAYFGTNTGPARVVKVNLSTFARTGAQTMIAGVNQFKAGCIDVVRGAVYFGSMNTPGFLVKISLASFSVTGLFPLNGLDEKNIRGAVVVDSANGYAYFGTSTVPTRVFKIDLSTFSRVASLELNSGENYARCAVLDTTGNAAFFGCDVDPTIIVKVNLATFTRSSALTLNAGESNTRCAAIDTANRMGYFGMNTAAGKVVKVNLATFARVSALTLNAGEDSLRFAVIDTAPNPDRLYVGTDTTAGRVIKIRLDTFARESALTLNAGEDSAHSAVIDTTGNALFVGTNTSPGIVVRIRLDTFARTGATTLNAGENALQTAECDTTTRMAYFPTGTTPGNVVKYNMAASARVGAIALETGENNPNTSVIDTDRGAIYLATYTNPAIVNRVLYGQKGKAKLTKFSMATPGVVSKFSFYSHTASGNLRLGLYREDSETLRTLVWESASTANGQTGGLVEINTGAGTPASLTIDPGTYHFAWQINTPSDVPSYTAGASGDGSYVVRTYSAYPATLNNDGGATSWDTTSEKWTGYITYALPTYTLTYTAGANGSISGTTPQTVDWGTNGTAVQAVPNVGYHFVNWSDLSTQNPRTDTNVTANVSVTANFELDVIAVTVTPDAWPLGARSLCAVVESGMFTLQNTGNVAEDFKIVGTDGAGGWTLAGAAGQNAFRVDVDQNDDGSYELVLSKTDQALFGNVAADATRSVGLKYAAPSSDTLGGGIAQDLSVTIKASKYVP